MPIQLLNYNLNSKELNKKNYSNKTSKSCSFEGDKKQEKIPLKVKAGVSCTTLAGIASVMAIVFKCKKMPFNTPAKFFKSLTTVHYNPDKPEIEALVSGLALGSVGGGLLGGAIFDKKENFKAKYREAVIQLVGNIFTPLAFVAAGTRGFEALTKNSKFFKSNKIAKLLEIGISAGCLALGIFTGNKVGNIINKKFFECKDRRKIKAADMSPHIDDLCLAGSLIAKDIKFIPRLIPLALVIAGVSTGTIQETNNSHNKDKKIKT